MPDPGRYNRRSSDEFVGRILHPAWERELDETTPKDPLHGMTLAAIVEDLVVRHGWPGLAERVPLRCFSHEPSVASSLKFLRKTDWARRKVERLYAEDQRVILRNAKRNRRRAAMRAHRAAQEGATRPGAGDESP